MRSAALLLAAGLAACGERTQPAWHEEAGYRWRELVLPRGDGAPGFTRMEGGRSGVRFENTVRDTVLLGNRMLGQGAGVALGDVDGDGRVDIFLARTEGANALYRNLGDWRFEDITAPAGVAAPDRYSSGAAFADVEGDGDLDLLLLATAGPNAIFLNDGHGRFTERRDLGLDPTGKGGTTLSLADADGDGDLELAVANYKPYSPVDTIAPQQRAFNQLVRQVAPGRFEVVPEFRRDFKLVMRPDMGGLNLSMRGEPDDFYLNDGGRYVRVPMTDPRFRDAEGRTLATEAESFTLGARFADLTGDRAPELYLANDFEDLDQLWINDGRGGFRLADWTVQRQTSNSAMGVDVGDLNGDGLPDLFEVDMLSNDSRRLKTQMPTHTALPKRPGDLETQLQQQRNTLFLNRGDGTFAEVGAAAGVQASGWSWSTMFLDVDLDGWPDILITAGHLWDIMDADVQERLQNRLTDVEWRRQRWQFPRLPLRNVAFRNRGDLTFEDAGERWRFGGEENIAHALAAADLDQDGDQDVVVNRLGPALLLRNDASAPRVAVRLRGNTPNTQAVGARIRLEGGAVPLQDREVAAGGLYLAHSDYLATFAMGRAGSAVLVVDWRDGARTRLVVHPNRLYEITAQAAGVPAGAAASDSGPAASNAAGSTTSSNAPATAPGASQPPEAGRPLFEDRTAMLGGHVHTEAPFDDWDRQFLLPNALSQLGPGVAWVDFDGDADDDLVVGAGRGGRLGLFRNDGGRLVPVPPGAAPAEADYTALVGLPSAGGTLLLSGVSSWEGPAPAAVAAIALARTGAGPPRPLLPAGRSSPGPLALGDVDQDGDLDLFVGGRVVPGEYPRSAASALYRNEGGRFVADTALVPLLGRAGLVSAALFADVDGDGDADLLLAREWQSLLLLLNERGRLQEAPASWGLAPWTSRWNGLAAGDLDGDGRLDLVATSWGRNTVTSADSARPLVLFHGPMGAGGRHELLLARQDPRLNALAILNSYPRVRHAIPEIPTRLGTFGAYADATAEQVLGPMLSRMERTSIVTLDHMVFLNRGGRFEARPLPVEAQLAPASFAGVADFDGDGAEDLFLSQNFFPTAVGIPRYDAGRSLLLSGDGRGGLTPLSGTASGLVVYGDQRGAGYADFDGDGRLDLAISQNASATRLFRNRGAAPGVRVRLAGPAGNPTAVGAQVRLVFGERMGPVREVHAGSGYWSQNGAVQVFGTPAAPTAVWVRWPGGQETRTAVPAGAREVVVRR